MARKKGFIERILDGRAKAKARRDREQLQAAMQARKAWAAVERERTRAAEQARRREDAERVRQQRAAERERSRELAAKQAAEQERLRRERQTARQQREAQAAAASEATRRRREEAQMAKELRSRKKEELTREARCLSEAMELRIRDLDEVLALRPEEPLLSPWVLESVFNREGVEAFMSRLEAALAASPLPWGVPSTIVVRAYRPEARELIVERQFPRVGIIPAEVQFRVVSDHLRATPRKPTEIARRYERLLASLALPAVDEVLRSAPATLVSTVVLDGRVTAIDPATGKTVTPLLLSLQVERSEFEGIRLSEPELDPVLCLKGQNAVMSPHPGDLVAVKPVLYYDLERYKTIQHFGLALDLDSRLDLLSLSPE